MLDVSGNKELYDILIRLLNKDDVIELYPDSLSDGIWIDGVFYPSYL